MRLPKILLIVTMALGLAVFSMSCGKNPLESGGIAAKCVEKCKENHSDNENTLKACIDTCNDTYGK